MAGFISKVTFPSGSCREESTVAAIAQHGDDFVLLASSTPFHPRDYRWPDRPEDRGWVQNAEGRRYALADAVFVGIDPAGVFSVGEEIPVKKTESGWYFCVGHVVRGERPQFAVGGAIVLQVDESHRLGLSRAHSAVHLMSLALNRALTPFWQKEAPWTDALGAPHFDQIAIARSEVGPLSGTDTYRLGKSLRKKGFAPPALRDDLPRLEAAMNATLAAWSRADAPVSVRAEGTSLADFRYWSTTIEDREIEIPCGGTHVRNLREIGDVRIRAEMPNEESLIIRTSVR